MKLAILVVYQFGAENRPLLDIHLNHIERHTGVPYTIYAAANRLEPLYQTALRRRQNIRICDVPTTSERGSVEHAHYLDHLAQIAAADDVTHIATLHLDSFPVRDRWAELLDERLSDVCVFATLDKISTACMLFRRDFYLEQRVSFARAPAARTDDFERFLSRGRLNRHSGVLFGFNAHNRGLNWYSLHPTAEDSDNFGAIYDDVIFHVHGAVRLGEQSDTAERAMSPSYQAIARRVRSLLRRVSPSARARVKRVVPSAAVESFARARVASEEEQMLASRRRLLENPDAYIAALRSGAQHASSI